MILADLAQLAEQSTRPVRKTYAQVAQLAEQPLRKR